MEPNDSRSDDGSVTLINVIEVAPEDVEAFTEGWRRLADRMASAAGFRGAQLHRALSGEARFQLVNVAHWDSEQAWRDAATDPGMQAAARRAGLEDPVMARAQHNTALYRPSESFAVAP